MERVDKVERLRVLSRQLHDKRHQDAVAHARVVKQLHGHANGQPEHVVHDLPSELLECMVEVGQLRRLPRHVHDERHQDALANADIKLCESRD